MRQFEDIIRDRGSRYAVSGGTVASAEDVEVFLRNLKSVKKYAKATHNSWAARLPGGPAKSDDGESGASAIILRMMERAALESHMIVVTRWYGGKHLGGDRFRHVTDAVRLYLSNLDKAARGA
jgi:putative IMPACT (imprinted ancient) family translation regulator